MDTVFGLEGKDFVLMVCDSTVTYSIMKQKVGWAEAGRRR